MVRKADRQAAIRVLFLRVPGAPPALDGLDRDVFRVREAPASREAVTKEIGDADAVLLTIGPGYEGAFEEIEWVRERAAATPVLVIGDEYDERLADRSLSEGAQDYLDRASLDRRGLSRAICHAIRRARTEVTRREALRSLFEYAPDAHFLTDLDGRFVDGNREAERLTGYAKADLLGETLSTAGLLSRDQVARVSRVLARSALGLPSGAEEYVLSRRDGETVAVEMRSYPIQIRQRCLVLAIARDISERKAAAEALRASEQQYRDLVNHATIGIYRSTIEGRFVSVNPALVEMLGYDSMADLLERDIARDVYAYPKERADLLANVADTDGIEPVECEWRRRDGEKIRVSLSGQAVRTAEGEISGFEMIAENVTERVKLERQLRQAQKMEAIGQLTGGIAHDFNNLLSVVLLHAQLAEGALDRGQAVPRADIDGVVQAARRGAAMTRQLLGFSRQAELELVPCDLAALLEDLGPMLGRLLPEDIELAVAVDPDVGWVEGDRGAIEQILLNVANNGRDAMPNGGRLRIELEERDVDAEHAECHDGAVAGRYARVSIADNGAGMDPETARRVFEPFFTTKPLGEGTGLGLSMAYGLVRQMNGFMSVYTVPGEGSVFRVWLPRLEPTAESVELAVPSIAELEGTETILLVEDEDALREVAARVLERHGYHVLTATDGEHGLEVFRDRGRDVDLVISDTVMPHMGGGDLHAALLEEGCDAPILLVSGYTGTETRQRRVPNGVPFLQKPWTGVELLQHVRRILEGGART